MDVQQHQHVFSSLVKDKDDPLQLLAYAIYKADKSEIAQKLSDNGRDPQQIDHELQNFHDAVIHSGGLQQSYYARAINIGKALFEATEQGIKLRARQDFIERVMQIVKTEQSWRYRAIAFLGEGIKGIMATTLVIILFSGIYALTLSKDERRKFLPAVEKSIADTLNGHIPLYDNYKDTLREKD